MPYHVPMSETLSEETRRALAQEIRREFASKGGRAVWKGKTKSQRSREMKRRAKVRRAKEASCGD